MAKPPAPFALSAQYVKSVGHSAEPPVDGEVVPSKGVEDTSEPPQAWNYNDVRMGFIKNHQADHGSKFAEAKTAWDTSSQKREYLGGVSLVELKRRRFLPKGADTNPWA